MGVLFFSLEKLPHGGVHFLDVADADLLVEVVDDADGKEDSRARPEGVGEVGDSGNQAYD